jgi:cobalt-zinc-cadmium efflux system outer membrane protein
MIRSFAGLVLACVCMFAPAGAADQGTGLTWGQALERALAGNASLSVQRWETEAAEARAASEALPPPFTLGAELDNFAGSGALRGTNSAEATLRIGRTLELGGKRQARIALGGVEVARAQHRSAVSRRELEQQTRLRFVEVLADQQRLEVAREHVELATRSRNEVARAVQRARNPETDLHTAELALADAELELEHAEHELAAARVTLASSWGEREASFGQAEGELESLVSLAPLEELTARLADSPVFTSAQLAREEAAARREVARASRHPDLTTSLGVRRLQGLDDNALVMSVSLPLGTSRRAGLTRRLADALQAARDSDLAAVSSEQYQELFERYQEAIHARTEFELLRDRMLPAARKSLALAQRGFDAGRFPFLTLVQSQEKLIELRRRQIDAAVRHHTLLAGIQLLAGLPAGVTP